MGHTRRLKKARQAANQAVDNVPLASKAKADDDASPIFFYRPCDPYGYLCQWYLTPIPCPVTGITFNCAEQYMMHAKAVLVSPNKSSDTDKAALILAAKDPSEQKGLGKKVSRWDEKAWEDVRFENVVEGNWLKFSTSKHLREKLLATGDRELVEAAPKDRVWGVGYNVRQAARYRNSWGQNLLGKALMAVRERLRAEEKHQRPEWYGDEEDIAVTEVDG
ncbi:MAG: hypothetical protein OHK93_006351 [Ramalina farinacea]|uniref:NADAR domain-containing protein n=1 Tax=Ramalina farinacea TaxID=258253 RepID=A0AA43QLV4_9LECA|nr:hypothetical protein [Ramalina farinacea]